MWLSVTALRWESQANRVVGAHGQISPGVRGKPSIRTQAGAGTCEHSGLLVRTGHGFPRSHCRTFSLVERQWSCWSWCEAVLFSSRDEGKHMPFGKGLLNAGFPCGPLYPFKADK